jgi:hypothetical protein
MSARKIKRNLRKYGVTDLDAAAAPLIKAERKRQAVFARALAEVREQIRQKKMRAEAERILKASKKY